MINQTATVKWLGGLKDGKGEISTESGALNKVPYSFGTRFGSTPGTNPEELIAAAHAACFSMALSGELQKINFTADSIKVQAIATLENTPQTGWKITQINLDVEAVVLGCSQEQLDEAANAAKINCPVSQALKTNIVMSVRLITLPMEVFF